MLYLCSQGTDLLWQVFGYYRILVRQSRIDHGSDELIDLSLN